MAKRTSKTTESAVRPPNTKLAQFVFTDVGNGNAMGIAAYGDLVTNPVAFEPVIAPITKQKGNDDTRPAFSLKTNDTTYVYGVNDVFMFGQSKLRRRLNSMERYTEPDYLRMSQVLWMHLFDAFRGRQEWVAPYVGLCVPIKVYNDARAMQQIADMFTGDHVIEDAEGCALHLRVEPDRLSIIPESSGALAHWVYDHKTVRQRGEVDPTGLNLVIDTGYLTTNCAVFDGTKYIRDSAKTFKEAGMINIVAEVTSYVRSVRRDADESRIDMGLRQVAGIPRGKAKVITIAPGIQADVTEVYDYALDQLVHKIADLVRTEYQDAFTRSILPGGSSYHTFNRLSHLLPFDTEMVPDAEWANCLGGLTIIRKKADRR